MKTRVVFFDVLNTKNAQIWQPQMEHDQSSYFCRALTIFAGALPPWAPPW